MTEYEQANRDNPKFAEFWTSQRSLCQIQLEKKKLQQTSAEPDEKLVLMSWGLLDGLRDGPWVSLDPHFPSSCRKSVPDWVINLETW